MAVKPTYNFQWQNPVLRQTIYPFREKKLKDFLLYFKEADLMRTMGDSEVDANTEAALVFEHNKLQAQLADAKVEKEKVIRGLKEAEQKHRAAASSREVRELVYRKANLESKLASLKSKLNTLQRRVDWYAQFAPDHPYYEKYSKEFEVAKIPYEQTNNELKTTEAAYNTKMAGYLSETKTLNAKSENLTEKINQTTEKLKKLPQLDKNGGVSPRAAVRWRVLQYEEQLAHKSLQQLLQEILDRFDQEPKRFPMWLRYMVIHFSGMRYQSAHGSWADAGDLLESLLIEDLTQRNRTASEAELDQAVAEAIEALQGQKEAEKDNQKRAKIERTINSLNNQYARQRATLEFQIGKAGEEIQDLSEKEVLDRLKARRNQFPDWVWKEIVSRTELRLEVEDENWETLTKEELQKRWSWEDQHWRAIMDAWERKDITAWRKEHERSLSLIVSRAVCNEVAEHIQHLRGLIPAGGLTSKPVWYLNNQKANPGQSYFRRPANTTDLKPGASILFLGWVADEPNAWQIAHPLTGADVLPASAKTPTVNRRGIVKGKGDTWKYRIEGNKFVRSAQPFINKVVNPPKVKTVKGPVIKEWLRWTHEATVVEVVEMADGKYVMTFETGQIGVNLRPLSQILNQWDIFVGFIPEADMDLAKLAGMLDRDKILPPVKPKEEVEPQPAIAFGLALEAEPVERVGLDEEGLISGKEIIRRWQSLTRREKQVVALICQGSSTREAATRLDTATSTINSHVSNAMGKFGVNYRESLCAWLADWDFSSVGL
jgi:DNA-binding CsgD family transcriptional regulator